MTVETVLFDLDGTLLDTAPEFATVLNAMRAEHGIGAMTYPAFRAVVSHGATAMLTHAFPAIVSDARQLDGLREEFLNRYANILASETTLFEGMDIVLQTLESSGMRWGIVTNKPGWLTAPLLTAMGLDQRAASVVSGDTLAERKPHPAPVLHGCSLASSDPARCVYVGDAERDIQAGRAAGLATAVALFGYIGPGDRPQDWGAEAMLASPLALLDWLEARAA